MELISYKTVKTRKPHNCWGCTKEFPASTEMGMSVSTDMGEISNAYWCEDCVEIMYNLEEWENEDGFTYGQLGDIKKESEE